MGSSVREKEIQDQATDWEDEYNNTPEHLVQCWAVGLQDLQEDDDVKDENDEADDSTTGAVFPRVSVAGRG